jgi:hypothetical protein
MSDLATLYAEVKGDVVALADPLFEQSRKSLQLRDDFLPSAAVMSADGRVVVLGAMTGTKGGAATAEQVLAMLQSGIRQMSRERVLTAIAISQLVFVTRANEPVQAIRVLVEHERGLAVAMNQPFWKIDGEYSYGEAFVTPAAPPLNLWPPVP